MNFVVGVELASVPAINFNLDSVPLLDPFPTSITHSRKFPLSSLRAHLCRLSARRLAIMPRLKRTKRFVLEKLKVDKQQPTPPPTSPGTTGSSLLAKKYTSNASHPLIALPSELLLNILAHLPTSDYLAVKHTSSRLRTLFIRNASHIANTQIRLHHADAAACLQSRLIDGWLVPWLPVVFSEEERHRVSVSQPRTRRASSFASRALAGELFGSQGSTGQLLASPFLSNQDFGSQPFTRQVPERQRANSNPIRITSTTKLSTPGPKFLHFLEQYGFEIQVFWHMYMLPPSRPSSASAPTSPTLGASTCGNGADSMVVPVVLEDSAAVAHVNAEITGAALPAVEVASSYWIPQPDRFAESVGLYCIRRFLAQQ